MSNSAGHEPASQAPGRRRLAYLALVPVVAILAAGAWLTVRLLSTPPPLQEASAGERARAAVSGRAEPLTAEKIEAIVSASRGYLNRADPASAAAILEPAVHRAPADQALRFLYGETLLTLGRKDEALEQYELGIAIGPDHAEYRFMAGTLSADLGRDEQADAHYAVAQTLDPSNPKHPLYRAQVQRRLGRPDAARANLMIATRLDPSLAVAWGALAGLALDENRLSVALGYVRRAREFEADRATWRVVEAKILNRQREPAAAANLLAAVPPEERAADPALLEEYALALGLLGKPDLAAEEYTRAAEAAPENAEMAFQAARWLDQASQADRALRYAEAAARRGHAGAVQLVERLRRSP
ncbi:MAG: tetratricopeptide repeat protein [Phycisphaerales bacterium]|nr:tetratricopeptide repeat protein [Phycisphaerales bacterium]